MPSILCLVFLHALIWSLLSTASNGLTSDIDCLKSIKDSLDDPFGYLNATWDFNNYTEGFICSFTGVGCWHADENVVLNIQLSDMGLKGQFPRGISGCSGLTGLDLSNNELSGPIPPDISSILPYLTSLKLSSNKFSGEIPKSLANITFLNVLNLDHNHLNVLNLDHNQSTGHIPPGIGLLRRLRTFTVANNLLYGPVPNFLYDISSDSFANNPGLCGKPLEPCKSTSESDTFKKGFVVSYAVSAFLVITTFISSCVPWTQDKKKKSKVPMQFQLHKIQQKKNERKQSQHMKKMPYVEFLHEQSPEISVLVKLVSRLSYTEINEATNYLKQENIIGIGQMGTTYKAVLPNGLLLAVKRLHDTHLFDEHFITELKTLGRLRHENLVPLLGFCIHSKEKLLVYKYMSKGSLYDWLHPEEGEARIMEWPLRVKIAIGAATGLVWLHQGCYFHVFHLAISSKCILLDGNFVPKLSNFGEAMLVKSYGTDSTESFSLNTEFWESSFAKEDVYCFGILLLELITREDPRGMTTYSDTSYEPLNNWVTLLSASSNFYSIVDKSLMGQGFDQEIFQFLKVALDCVQPYPDQRPTMLQLYKKLAAIGKRHGLSTDSEVLTHHGETSTLQRDECNEDEIVEV
ncbi:hypothetical protein SLEP1_g58252 [Rubroshorea leprosula]|uniref:Protein kinase domain-containing protein n=1 Tax=Rubroshorea leprosula TaxID=152421 RepID=A0AAV5MQ08_9ROSI|nr:hypothetical protein SLEP1_g58252 [Rubroshorea leprosula]